MTTAKNKIIPKGTTNREVSKSKKKKTIFDLIEAGKDQFALALPKHVDCERFVRIALTCVRQNPKLSECTQESLLGALMTSAQLGLEPGILGQAYLIPYSIKGTMECQFQLSYKGMVELLRRSGQLSNLRAHTVYENDKFEYKLGLDMELNHTPILVGRGKPIAYYVVAELSDGNKSFLVMSKEDIENHERDNRKGQYRSNVWKNHFDAMAHKTVAKQLMKWLPVSVEYIENIAKDDTLRKADVKNINVVEEIEVDTFEIGGDGELIAPMPTKEDIDNLFSAAEEAGVNILEEISTRFNTTVEKINYEQLSELQDLLI